MKVYDSERQNEENLYQWCFPCAQFQIIFFSLTKLLSNTLKMQFNLNKCIIRGMDGEVISMGLCNDNLNKIKYKKVHKACAIDLVQSWRKEGAFELWAFECETYACTSKRGEWHEPWQSYCHTYRQYVKNALRGNNLRRRFPTIGEGEQINQWI